MSSNHKNFTRTLKYDSKITISPTNKNDKKIGNKLTRGRLAAGAAGGGGRLDEEAPGG